MTVAELPPTETKLTDEQARAIGERSVSIALSAGAGCGKTFVLTERFLAHLTPGDADAPPADLSELIAITFTERAAREMRDRVRRQCFSRLHATTTDADADYWWQLLRGLDAARISTIHSFCAALLRTHAVEAGLDPGFRILEELQANTIWSETVDDTLRERLADRDELTIDLVVRLGLEQLREMLTAVLRHRRPEEMQRWLDATPDDLLAAWQSFQQRSVAPLILERIATSPHTTALLQILGDYDFSGPRLAEMRDRRATLLDLLPKLGHSTDPAGDLTRIREAARVQGGGGKKGWPSKELYEQFKVAAESLRREIDKAGSVASFDLEAARPAAELGLCWLSLAAHVAEAYDRTKQEQALLDFDDIIARTRRLLTAPDRVDLRTRLASHVTLLLVDEFQDTDPEQVDLVKALCGDVAAAKLFFVGDRKQSIYRFRGADPTVFRKLEQSVPAQGRLPLTLNFRSQPAVLDFVNATFCDAMGRDYEALRPHRPQLSPTPSVELWWAQQQGNSRAPGAKDRARRQEADLIARRLREMFDSSEPIIPMSDANGSSTLRCVQPRDVVLLFRVLSDVQYYEAALRSHGIDYYLVGGHAFYAQQEIFDVLNLLRTLASSCDDVALAGVLRSPFFALADETLFWLAQHPGGLSAGLFGALPRELEAEQRHRAEFAARTITELRACKDRMPVADLINETLARTGYDAVLLSEFLGERKLANLRKLIEQARAVDRAGALTLSDFILQLSEFVVAQPREALAATHPEETDVVRLMTIHQAKGLEFPVAVVVDVDRPKNLANPPAIFTDELGPLVKPLDNDGDSPCAGYDLYTYLTAAEDDEETVRLLYVAMTRAADRLILSGSVYDLDSPSGPWTRLLAERFDLHTGAPHMDTNLPDPSWRPAATVVYEASPPPAASSTHHGHVDIPKLLERARRLAADGRGRVPAHVGAVAPDASAPREFSFSRLDGRLYSRRPSYQSAASAAVDDVDIETNSPNVMDPRGLGTLVHAVLEEVPLDGSADVAALVERFAEQHLDSNVAAGSAEAADVIARFLKSPPAAELAAAKELYRELEFLLTWPPGTASTGGHSLRGFIDCLSRDVAGRWHLLDYKTNHVTKSALASTAANYELQLGVYALAAEQILGQPPASLRLYFLRLGLEHTFPWNTAARSRTIERVNQAMHGQPAPVRTTSSGRRRQADLFAKNVP